MTEELKRHKNFVWGLPDLSESQHPHTSYPVDWAIVSVLQDIRDNLALILQELSREEPKRKWWKLW